METCEECERLSRVVFEANVGVVNATAALTHFSRASAVLTSSTVRYNQLTAALDGAYAMLQAVRDQLQEHERLHGQRAAGA